MKEIQIYVVKEGRKTGPFSLEQIQAMLGSSELSLNDSAWSEGHETWKSLHVILGVSPPAQAAQAITGSAGSSSSKPAYLYIPTSRLIFMSVFSLGIFVSYWVYKNWRYIKERDGLDIMPFWRGWFAFFHFYPLLKHIKEDPMLGHTERPDYSSGWLTFGFIIFTICGNQLIIPSMVTFLFILPAHNYITRINEADPNRPGYSPWSFGQIFCVAFIPVVFFAIVVFAAFMG